MVRIVYYVPTLPDIWSTDRYQHALAITEIADRSLLLTAQEPPRRLSESATAVRILESDSILARGKRAAEHAKRFLGIKGCFVTVAHEYECTVAGFLARRHGVQWVLDVFEAPAMPRLNRPRSLHQLTTRVNEQLLNTAELAIHSFHPDTPYQYGKSREFILNGSPVSQIDANITSQEPLRIALVSSYPSFQRGGEYLLRAAEKSDEEVEIHICGEPTRNMTELATDLSVTDTVTFHGWVDHAEALNQVALGDVGYCVLPPRTDYKYAPPIKVGEYLAGGTIPIVSNLSPGCKYMADKAGYDVSPSTEGVATAISELASATSGERERLKQQARIRGEEIAWENIRRQFIAMLTNNNNFFE